MIDKSRSFFLDGVTPERYSLPHPKIVLPVILIIHRAITEAFFILRSRPNPNLGGMAEDELTIALYAVLENDLRQSGRLPGFNRDAFDRINRQHRVVSYDGSKISKEPDMRFNLRDDSRQQVLPTEDGLIVECKPVDKAHPVTTDYCNQGMQRFVNGDYAWAMQEALMIAFSRHGRTVDQHLLPAMRKRESIKKLRTLKMPSHIAESELNTSTKKATTLHYSQHHRNFTWRENKGNATPITLYHSWHPAD